MGRTGGKGSFSNNIPTGVGAYVATVDVGAAEKIAFE